MRHRFYLLMAVCYCCLQTSIIANNATENFLHFTKDGFPLKVEPDAPLPPSLTCPGDMIFDLAPGECSIVVTFDVSAQAANPGDIVTITQTDGTGFISGDAFPIGTTVLSFDATDPTGTVSCTFSITVNEFTPASDALTCNGNVNISLASNCKATITPNMILEGNYGCFDNFTVDVNGTGTNVVDNDLLGQTISISVTNVLTGNTCWGNGFVEDKLPPLITGCDSVFINCFQNPLPVSEGGDVPDPSISDCSSFDVFHVDEMIQGGCDSTFTMLIRRNWTATDASGRVSTCTQVITIQKVSLIGTAPVCPADVAVECAFGSLQSLAPSVTGYPTLLVGGTVYDIANNSNSVCTITSGFSDDTIPHCGASFRIIRTWTVIDWCQPLDFVNNPWTCLQLLDFNDNTPPGLSAPAHFTVGTDVGSCTATPVIPPAVVFDCSGLTVTILTPVGTINGNGGQVPSPGLNFGDNLITFKATDDCGNISTDTLTITVIDDVKPHPVCQSFTTVGLDGNGFAKAFAAAFDAGSNDNCCLDGFQVRRMGDNCGVPENTSFGDFVTFCCADLGSPVIVVFRAFDCWGNFNDCMVQVEVQDKIIPQFTCPQDITIECGQDHTDLSLTGQIVTDPSQQSDIDGLATDNCDNLTISHSDFGTLDCGQGIIFRTWTVTDLAGQSFSCDQKITVENTNTFTNSSFIWPADLNLFGCNGSTDPTATGSPILPPDGGCAILLSTFSDEIFTNVPGACRKILRTWVVIDWCSYDPNNPASGGRWEHVQEILVNDIFPPVFAICTNRTFCNFQDLCTPLLVDLTVDVSDDCTDNANLQISWVVDAFDDGLPDTGPEFSGTGQNSSNSYQPGTHRITYTVTDDCDNTAVCSFLFTIEDCKKPTVVCDNGLVVELMMTGDATISAILFDEGSTNDNCTPPGTLIFSFSPDPTDVSRTYTCDNLGVNQVDIWVTDEAGNQDFCSTQVFIQDNLGACPGALMVNLGGQIQTQQEESMDAVQVELSGNSFSTTQTNGQGFYEFSSLPAGNDYTVTPVKDDDPLNGVSTYDLVLLNRHILNIDPLDSPYKRIAADVNRSGTISVADMIEIRSVILQIKSTFLDNTSWRFVEANYQFPDPANPFATPFPEVFNINNLMANSMATDFKAIKIGDLSGNAIPGNFTAAEDRNTHGSFVMMVDDGAIKAGEEVSVDFRAIDLQDILGCQFTLNFDMASLELIDLIPGAATKSSNFGFALLEEGAITASWDNASLQQSIATNDSDAFFTLVFKAKRNAHLSELLDINSRFTKAESYALNGDLQDVSLNFRNETGTFSSSDKFELYQNIPNPFKEATIIGFQLPEASTATLTVYDLSGRVLKTVTKEFAAGYNEVELKERELAGNGVLYYELASPTRTATKRMVLIR